MKEHVQLRNDELSLSWVTHKEIDEKARLAARRDIHVQLRWCCKRFPYRAWRIFRVCLLSAVSVCCLCLLSVSVSALCRFVDVIRELVAAEGCGGSVSSGGEGVVLVVTHGDALAAVVEAMVVPAALLFEVNPCGHVVLDGSATAGWRLVAKGGLQLL
jgi:hypothetical protein